MKFFNTAGKTDPVNHYFLPRRLDWDELTEYIEKKYYFLLHAPRQSGKTSSFIEFVNHLNHVDKYTALYVSFESTRSASNANDVQRVLQIILNQLWLAIKFLLPTQLDALLYLEKALQKTHFLENEVANFFSFWAEHNDKPLVLFLDEFDVLTGDPLVTLLTQFRAGYTYRPQSFPQTICLIGVRDLREYKIKTQEQIDMGVLISPFNIKAESLILPDFTPEQVRDLYLQHTQETGQKFDDDAIEYAFEQTQGQPWLVNALAYQACFRDVKDRSIPITKDILIQAREALIKRQDTHIDALVDRLNEPRVYKIMDAIISSSADQPVFDPDNISYVRDLGLMSRTSYTIANPMYKEVIPRALSKAMQERFQFTSALYLDADGTFNMHKMLQAYTDFFRQNSGTWLKGIIYHESGPHLLTQAFFQRVINGGGMVNREYALDAQHVDLFVTWKTQKFVIEIKVYKGPQTIVDGIKQLLSYIDKSGGQGHLIIFDRSPDKTWEEKIYHRQEVVDGKAIEIWGM